VHHFAFPSPSRQFEQGASVPIVMTAAIKGKQLCYSVPHHRMLPQFSLAFLAVPEQGAVSPCSFDESCEVFQSHFTTYSPSTTQFPSLTRQLQQQHKSDSILLRVGGGESESVVKVSIALLRSQQQTLL